MGGAERVLAHLIAGVRRAHQSWPIALLTGQDGPLVGEVREFVDETIVLPFPTELARLGDANVGDTQRPSMQTARFFARAFAGGTAASAYARRLRKPIMAFEPDVIHSNSLKMHLLTAWTKPSNAALVWHLHDYIGSRRLTSRLLQRLRRRCSAVVANSASVAADARCVLGPDVQIQTIYNSVDTDRFNPDGPALDLDALAGLPPAAPRTIRVGLVATFALWKGHLTFLDAVSSLVRRDGRPVQVRAYVIGGPLYETDGSQHSLAELQDSARRLGIESNVGFTGFVTDTAAAMRALDIVVHASTDPEPFGLVVAEAMATGRALVVSFAGGVKELVTPGVDALVHQPGDAAGLADAIHQLAIHSDLRGRLASAGRRTAVERFSPARARDELLTLYGSLRSTRASTLESPVAALN
jgi:glycosyltransferase involved in cell wall biosynthesis